MKNLFSTLTLFLILACNFHVSAQYIPSPTSYSWKNGLFRSALQIPTNNGYPLTLVNAPDTTRSAIYFDSTNEAFYVFNPATQLWILIGGGGLADTNFIRNQYAYQETKRAWWDTARVARIRFGTSNIVTDYTDRTMIIRARGFTPNPGHQLSPAAEENVKIEFDAGFQGGSNTGSGIATNWYDSNGVRTFSITSQYVLNNSGAAIEGNYFMPNRITHPLMVYTDGYIANRMGTNVFDIQTPGTTILSDSSIRIPSIKNYASGGNTNVVWNNTSKRLELGDGSGGGTTPSWNSTMAISPDLLQDYNSNFHASSWLIDSVHNYSLIGSGAAGANAVFQFESVTPSVTLRVQSPTSINGVMELTSSGSILSYGDGTEDESFQANSDLGGFNKLYLHSTNNKIQMDLDSAGPPTNSLWQDADGFIHRGAISGGGTGGCDTCWIPLSAILPTIAALPAYVRGLETIVFVKEPVRGGMFKFSATGTVNNGETFPASGGGFWVRDQTQSQAVNLTWFGDSLGRGVSSLTRDTTALHAAFAYLQSVGGGTLYAPNPPAFYAFAGHPIWFGDNIKLYGDGPEKSEIRNVLPSTGGNFKGPIFQFSTYSSNGTTNPFQVAVPKYELYTANINDTVLRLRNIGDAAGLSVGEVIMYGCLKTFKGDTTKPEFTYWELNEVTRISNDSVFFKLPIRINLIDDAAGAHPLLLNINNAGISPLYGFANGTVKNIEISNIKLTQAQEGGNADTTLTNSLAGIWQPGGAFDFYFHDLVIDAYSGIGGNMFTYGTFEKIHFRGEKKFFDAGYGSSRLRFIDCHDEYKESPASNFATARLIFNSGVHDLYIQNHLSDGDNFRGTQYATFAGVQGGKINGFHFNYPNFYNDNNAINISGDSARPSKDIYINDLTINANAVGQFLRISQDPNTTLANSNINITNADFHGGLIGNDGNVLFTFTFTATNPPVRNDEYSTNGSTYAFRGGKSTDIGNGVFQAPFIRISGTNDPLSSGTLTRTLGAGDATLGYSSVVVADVSEPYALNTSNVRGVHVFNLKSEQGKFYINRDSNSTFLAMQTTDSLLAKFNYNTDIGATVPTASDTCLGNALSIIGGIGYINCARLGGGGSAADVDTFQTDGVNNSSQSLLNLVAGSNIGLTESNGSVTIDAIVDTTGCEVFSGWGTHNVDSHTLEADSLLVTSRLRSQYLIDSLGNKKVDTLYRTPGKDSIQFTIGGRYHAIKDSSGISTFTETDPLSVHITDSAAMLSPYVNAIAGENYLSKSGHVITANPVNLSNTNVTSTLPIGKGGTNITTYTTGDILYASATNVLSKLPIGTATQVLHVSGGVPAWRDTASITCCYWPLSGTGLGTGVTTITYNAPNQLTFNGTYTTTANNQWWRQESPTVTLRATASDVAIGRQYSGTYIIGANNQEVISSDYNPTVTLGAFTGTEQTAIRSKGNINPNGNWNLGRTANTWAGVYATRWYGTVWDANGANNLQVNINGYKPISIISATQNIKFGSITTTTVDSLYKVDINGDAKVMGGLVVASLPTPTITSVTNQGAAGSTTYTYKLIYRDVAGNISGASAAVSTTTGNATLSPTNFNRINFSGTETTGLTAYYKDIYRTVGGATQGKVATSAGYAITSADDIGGAGDGTTAPANNNSGNIGVGILRPTAGIDIRAGIADVSGGQIKFRNSTAITTTPEIGGMSFKDGLWYIDSSNSVRDTIAGRRWVEASPKILTNTTIDGASNTVTNVSVTPIMTGWNTSTVAASTTQYGSVTSQTLGNSALNRYFICPMAGTIGNLYVLTNSTQDASGSLVVNVYKNGTASAVTITVAAGAAAATFSDVTHTVSVAAGDRLVFQIINNATATSATLIGAGFTITK